HPAGQGRSAGMTLSAKQAFKQRVRHWARQLDVPIAWLAVRPMRQKWASCSTGGHLHFSTDLLNAGWKAQRIGAITEAQFAAIAELAPSLFSVLVPAAALLSSAQRWCRQLDHPAYDCLYLALAEQRSAVLLTQDQRLLRKLESAPDAADLAMPLERWQARQGLLARRDPGEGCG
ncbi:MAG: YgjP-like metallopeptidase domain-containing protein, partial [Cyanobium sp.]